MKDYTNAQGHLYRYDPECQCYYRVFSREEYRDLPHWDKFGWLYVTAILTAVCFWSAL
jgi:hypothetical protein